MGLDLPIQWLSVLMFGALRVLLLVGLPLAFFTGGLGVVFLYLVGDQAMLNLMPSRIFPMMTNYQLSAVPLFIFMASILEKAGIIEELFDVVYKWMGGLKAGLASATVISFTLLAAMVGVIGAAVVTMGMIALPAMLKRNYDPEDRLRLDHGRRDPGHPDSAVDPGDHLRRGRPAVGRRALSARSFPAFCSRACMSATLAARHINPSSGRRCRSRSG